MTGAIGLGLRIFFVMLFLVSGQSKLRDPRAFHRGLEGYRLLPQRVIWPVAVMVMLAEFAIAVGLAFRPQPTWPIVVALLVAFGAAELKVLWTRETVTCHCFNSTEVIDGGSLVRTAWLGAGAALAMILGTSHQLSLTDNFLAGAVVVAIAATGMVWAKGNTV